MKREIKFRGLRVDGKGWVYGYLTHSKNEYTDYSEINPFESFSEVKVTPESVGQFTGLKDKNGTDIYEGDIVKDHPYYTQQAQIRYGNFNASFGFQTDEDEDDIILDKYNSNLMEVVGSIHK